MYGTDDTIVNEADGHFIFPYDSAEYTKDFASVDHAKTYEVGTYVTVSRRCSPIGPKTSMTPISRSREWTPRKTCFTDCGCGCIHMVMC